MEDCIKNIVVIPVRLASSRFPNKPFVKLNGLTMIEHTWLRSTLSKLADEVVIATPDLVIKNHMSKLGAKIIMTSHSHKMCMDRVNEAIKKMKLYKSNIVVVQGDEPLVNPKTIDTMFKKLKSNKDYDMISVIKKIDNKKEIKNSNRVKVVFSKNFFVHFISREPIPSNSTHKNKVDYYKLICLYGLNGIFLKKYSQLGISKNEKIESIDILRVIDNGYKLKIFETKDILFNVDTKRDVKVVKKAMLSDNIFKSLKKINF